MSLEELKPCPFCGVEMIELDHEGFDHPKGDDCILADTSWSSAYRSEWNTRPSLPPTERDEGMVERVAMLLFCPKCGLQHVDAPDERTPGWTNPPHKSHLCHGCGCIWRPADVPTDGVLNIETSGKADNWVRAPKAARAAISAIPDMRVVDPALVEALERAWTDFLDANPDDLTSPSDLPDHALVTCEQMIDIVRNAMAELSEALSVYTMSVGGVVNQGVGRPFGQPAEGWREIAGHPDYRVSDRGRVMSAIGGGQRILAAVMDNYGYATVKLRGERRKIHRLVCEAFHGPPPPDADAAHLDGNRTNNVPANLAWVSRKENMAHKVEHGTHQTGEAHGGAKLTAEQVASIRERAASGESRRSIARGIGISSTQVDRIVNGEHWRLGPAGECQAQEGEA